MSTQTDLGALTRGRRELALLGVNEERLQQLTKWGDQHHHPYEWLAILNEELGEIAKVLLEGEGQQQYAHELTQLAAVAVAAIEDSFENYPDEDTKAV